MRVLCNDNTHNLKAILAFGTFISETLYVLGMRERAMNEEEYELSISTHPPIVLRLLCMLKTCKEDLIEERMGSKESKLIKVHIMAIESALKSLLSGSDTDVNELINSIERANDTK